jgi:hypothetical protein
METELFVHNFVFQAALKLLYIIPRHTIENIIIATSLDYSAGHRNKNYSFPSYYTLIKIKKGSLGLSVACDDYPEAVTQILNHPMLKHTLASTMSVAPATSVPSAPGALCCRLAMLSTI